MPPRRRASSADQRGDDPDRCARPHRHCPRPPDRGLTRGYRRNRERQQDDQRAVPRERPPDSREPHVLRHGHAEEGEPASGRRKCGRQHGRLRRCSSRPNEDRLAADATTLRGTIISDGIFDCDRASRAWQYGEFVGIYRDATPLNANQQVALPPIPARQSGSASRTPAASRRRRSVAGLSAGSRPSSRRCSADSAVPPSTATAMSDTDTTLTVASTVIQTGDPRRRPARSSCPTRRSPRA